ncbi:MAG: flagellar biosynthesis anti-sigma factor FlgM [Gammaproteobacteria bacterium]|nr:flagellar biosynthesis anti-sigma factor FlgM [Gammaproteobacteria bacterium]
MTVNNITGNSTNQPQRATEDSQVEVARSEPTVEQQETGRPSSVDTVSLTDTAARLRELENTLATLPVVDAQRVEDIQKSIAEGSFDVDPEKIAVKILEFEGELNR